MKREIKFRAFNKKESVMYQDIAVLTNEESQKSQLSISSNRIAISTKNDGYSIMQYTGLKDKNGKEIYEGDILDDNKPWVVKSSTNGAWMLDYANGSGEKYLYPIMQHLEIIGNIYENPELLKS